MVKLCKDCACFQKIHKVVTKGGYYKTICKLDYIPDYIPKEQRKMYLAKKIEKIGKDKPCDRFFSSYQYIYEKPT